MEFSRAPCVNVCMGRLVALLVFVGGCSAASGPIVAAPTQDDLAFTTLWEGLYGMETSSRPTVEWYDDACRGLNWSGVTNPGTCQLSIVDSDGMAYVKWIGSYHESDFSLVLVKWKKFLETSHFGLEQSDYDAVTRGSDLLMQNGL